jgi:hypothetical protein
MSAGFIYLRVESSGDSCDDGKETSSSIYSYLGHLRSSRRTPVRAVSYGQQCPTELRMRSEVPTAVSVRLLSSGLVEVRQRFGGKYWL